jgi:hypothetical protein
MNTPTHSAGHTLDLIISLDLSISKSYTCDPAISDNLAVFANIELPTFASKPRTIQFRKLKTSIWKFSSSVQQSDLLKNSQQDTDSLVSNYNNVYDPYLINMLPWLPRYVSQMYINPISGILMIYMRRKYAYDVSNVGDGNTLRRSTAFHIKYNVQTKYSTDTSQIKFLFQFSPRISK